jgi:branched-chain amino acid transport system substrate-binding protein
MSIRSSSHRQYICWSIPCLMLALALFALCPAAHSEQNPNASPFKIGFIGPLTGPAASYGIASKNGIELALEELGASSGIQVLYEDDQFQPAKTVAAFRKFTEVDKVDALISVASGPSNAVAPLAQAKNILLFAWASDPRVSYARSSVVRTYPSGQAEGQRAAEEAQRLGYQAMGVYYAQSDYSHSVREGLVTALPKTSIRDEEEVQADASDFKSLLVKARARGVKQYFICFNPAQPGLFAKQMRQLQIDAPIFGCESMNAWSEVTLSEGALKGAWFASVQPTPAFRQRYQKRFGNDDVISGAAIHYDLIRSLQPVVRLPELRQSPQKLVRALIDAGVRSGAIPSFFYRTHEDDQHLQIELSLRRIGGQGFEEHTKESLE